ncbi:polypeptide deformylase family protein, partial [Chlamydia psittaci C1/97]
MKMTISMEFYTLIRWKSLRIIRSSSLP